MRQFVESLRRIYLKNLITAEKVASLLSENKINQQEMEYIIKQD